jgi:acylphosphatase
MVTLRFVVYGRVQGVGFRWFVWREAERLGLCGFVRNLRDGSVEVIAGGTAGALEELGRILEQGPAHAHVERVDRSDVPHELVLPNDFDIK